ncbi:MAG: FGGY family carbohydrate kinase [Saprospiraceae bacterium]
MYLLGLDIGSSSIKASLVDAATGLALQTAKSPEKELPISAPQLGWAEQDPDVWWEHVCLAIRKLLSLSAVNPAEIKAIGIAYQMHGLVVIDKQHKVLRPSIIWCDSRASKFGEEAFSAIGEEACLNHLLNSPGNFTASKLKWVKDNEPHIYDQIYKIMLPGDYIAFRLTGEVLSTVSGLSEGVFWDFKTNTPSSALLDYYGFDPGVLPELHPSFSLQGELHQKAATETGLSVGTKVTYRAGDQPNNALSLNVLEAGEVAATGGTSGVVYGVVDKPAFDTQSRVNSFAHVNYTVENPMTGILLCINGAGIQYSWVKNYIAESGISYADMEMLASGLEPGSEGLRILPFGNGAERIFGNKLLGSQINNLQLNIHQKQHIYRAALEGIAFSFVYGVQILQDLGVDTKVIRAGNDNLFQSAIFSGTISNLLQSRIELIDTTGAIGAAKAAGVAIGYYASPGEAVGQNKTVKVYEPESNIVFHQNAYQKWLSDLNALLDRKDDYVM